MIFLAVEYLLILFTDVSALLSWINKFRGKFVYNESIVELIWWLLLEQSTIFKAKFQNNVFIKKKFFNILQTSMLNKHVIEYINKIN